MEGFEIFEWKDCPVDMLREYVLANVSPAHKTCESHEVPQVFKDYARQIIEDQMGYEVDHWVYWISDIQSLDTCDIVPPEHNREWQLKFPHTHQWDGRTMILYLQVPEEGGGLAVLDENMEELDCFEPKVGFAAVMGDHAIHGIKAIKGDINRVTMIAGAYPYPNTENKCQCEDKSWPRVTN